MKAQDIMTRDPRCVTPDAEAKEVAELMAAENVGVIPVVDSEDSRRLVGVVTDRDIAIRVVAEGRGATTTVRDIMSPNVKTHGPNDSVDAVMNTMADAQVRRVPIVDDQGSLVGIVAQADVLVRGNNDRKGEQTVERISQP